jgi:hypothetical protein
MSSSLLLLKRKTLELELAGVLADRAFDGLGYAVGDAGTHFEHDLDIGADQTGEVPDDFIA